MIEVGAILPMSNAVSECGLSKMNYIKGTRFTNMSSGEGITGDDDDDGAAQATADGNVDDAANEDANRLADEGTAESANSLATLCVTSSTKQKKAEGSKVNMLETRVFLFIHIHMPPRGPELENLLGEVADSFWGLCKRQPKRANGAVAANKVRRENGEKKRAEKRRANQDIISGASAKQLSDSASASER